MVDGYGRYMKWSAGHNLRGLPAGVSTTGYGMWIPGWASFRRNGASPWDIVEFIGYDNLRAMTREGNVLKASNGTAVFRVDGDELVALVDGLLWWP